MSTWIETTKRRSDGSLAAREFNPPEADGLIVWSDEGLAKATDELAETLIEIYDHIQQHDGDPDDDGSTPVEKASDSTETGDGSDAASDATDATADASAPTSPTESDGGDETETGEVAAEEDIVIDTSADDATSPDEPEPGPESSTDETESEMVDTGAESVEPSNDEPTEPEE